MARSAIIGVHVAACLILARCAAGGPPEPQADPAPAPAPAPAAPKPAERPATGTVRVLSIEQEAMGLPDQRSEVPVRQKILLDGDHNRVILTVFGEPAPSAVPGGNGAAGKKDAGQPEADRRIILRMDYNPPEIYEVWDSQRIYRRTNRDLNRIQEDRDKYESTSLRHLGALPPAERKDFLEENFYRPDGKRIVEVVRGGKSKILGYDCEEVTVTENGRQVIRAWITRDAGGAKNYFHLYRRLGAFSKEVLEKVAGLEGLPLQAEITVVTAAPAFKISTKCLSVKVEDVPDNAFEIPAGYQERKDEQPAVVKCGACEKELEPDRAPYRINDLGVGMHYYCSQKCWEQGKKDQERRDRERSRLERAAPGGATGGQPAPAGPGSGPGPGQKQK